MYVTVAVARRVQSAPGMRKKMRQLSINRETVRVLSAANLRGANGGYDTSRPMTKVPGDDTSEGCSNRSVCGCPTNACTYLVC